MPQGPGPLTTEASPMSADREFPSDIAFTDTVKAIQEKSGSRSAYARMEQGQGWQTTVTPDLAFFLSDKDMFYLGTANAEGQPYIQYRGGRQASSRSSTTRRSASRTLVATASTWRPATRSTTRRPSSS
jgi:hypothetical protein